MRLLLVAWFFTITLLADAHIFVYHRFGDDKHPSTNTSIEILKNQFEYFKKNGYKVVPLKRVVNALKKGEKIPDKWVVLTIDDAYKSFYKNALPIFKEYNYPFTLFVYTEATNKRYPDFMNWEEIKEAMKYGEVGFHSHTHPHMVSKSDDFLKEDFKKGLSLMQEKLGFTPKYFAYPYGEYDDRVKSIAKRFGFEAIFNQNSGAVSELSEIFDLDRIALTQNPNLKSKLKSRYLATEWIEPTKWPSDAILKKVYIKTDSNASDGLLYVTGYGWQKVSLKQGVVKKNMNIPLKNRRSRIILKLEKDKISTKILVKP